MRHHNGDYLSLMMGQAVTVLENSLREHRDQNVEIEDSVSWLVTYKTTYFDELRKSVTV